MDKDERHIVTLRVCELQEAIRDSVEKQLKEFIEEQNAQNEEKDTTLIPRKKVAEMFQISTVSLDKWRRKGLLPDPIKQGRKIYYLRSEIERMIIERKQYYYEK